MQPREPRTTILYMENLSMARRSLPPSERNHPVERQINTPKQEQKRILIPSGSIMLNLACSNTHRGAYELGRMVNLIGDSGTGKTYLALEMMAQCAERRAFKNHRLIYDDPEHALSMDIPGLFGRKLADRLIAPNDEPVLDCGQASYTMEEFEYNFMRALKEGPCIYVLDSFDALTCEQDLEKVAERHEAYEKGKEVAGSYNMAKAKLASQVLRNVVSLIDNSDSFLFIISQTRDNITPGSFEKRTRSGGKALKFYASHEIWLACTGKLKQAVNKKQRVIGQQLRAKVSKNKLTGAFREVDFDFRHGYGCDDIASALEFLLQENAISGSSKNLTWGRCSGTFSKVVSMIEDDGLEAQLFNDVQETWPDVEERLKPKRKPKYASE